MLLSCKCVLLKQTIDWKAFLEGLSMIIEFVWTPQSQWSNKGGKFNEHRYLNQNFFFLFIASQNNVSWRVDASSTLNREKWTLPCKIMLTLLTTGPGWRKILFFLQGKNNFQHNNPPDWCYRWPLCSYHRPKLQAKLLIQWPLLICPWVLSLSPLNLQKLEGLSPRHLGHSSLYVSVIGTYGGWWVWPTLVNEVVLTLPHKIPQLCSSAHLKPTDALLYCVASNLVLWGFLERVLCVMRGVGLGEDGEHGRNQKKEPRKEAWVLFLQGRKQRWEVSFQNRIDTTIGYSRHLW